MLIRKIKRIGRNVKMNRLIDRINWCEGAIVDQGREYFPFGLYDYCNYQSDSIREVLNELIESRKGLLDELKRKDKKLYEKLYPDEEKKEAEFKEIVEKSCKNADDACKIFAENAKNNNDNDQNDSDTAVKADDITAEAETCSVISDSDAKNDDCSNKEETKSDNKEDKEDSILFDYDNKDNYKKVKIGNARKNSRIVYSVEIDGKNDITLSLLQLIAEMQIGALKDTARCIKMDAENKAYFMKFMLNCLRDPAKVHGSDSV